MAKFIALVSHEGLIGPDYLDRPAPDPAAFGLPSEDDGSRDDPLLRHNIITCTHYGTTSTPCVRRQPGS